LANGQQQQQTTRPTDMGLTTVHTFSQMSQKLTLLWTLFVFSG
jgi:hypothetical protein